MVRGPSPGPAPAAQARASSSRLTRSSWRTWPYRKLRRKVPRVDGALTTQPRALAVLPVRNASTTPMRCAPAALTPPGSQSCRPCSPDLGHCPGRGAAGPVGADPGAGPKGRARLAIYDAQVRAGVPTSAIKSLEDFNLKPRSVELLAGSSPSYLIEHACR